MPITINGTTGISGVDGSTSVPAVIGSDTDTGLVFSAGRIQASLNGTSANVGLTQATAQNSTSGTVIDFTGIPSWAKRITVIFNEVSTNGTSQPWVQLGTSGGVVTSGYLSTSNFMNQASGTAGGSHTAAFGVYSTSATNVVSGIMTITNVSGNIWISSHSVKISTTGVSFGAGSVTLSATLDRVRITSATPDTFDAGSVNIFYE